MAKLWRRAWGWVGTGERRSRMRRTSRGPSRFPRRLKNRAGSRPCPLSGGASEGGPGAVQPRPDGRSPPFVDQHLALLGALARHRDHQAGEVHVGDVQSAQLGHPQPTPVEQLQHGVVPPVHRRRRRGILPGHRLQQLVQLSVAEDPGQPRVGRRGRQPEGRVRGQKAPLGAPLEVRAERGGRPGDRGLGVAAGGQIRQVPSERDPIDVGRPLGTATACPFGESLDVRGVGPHRRRREATDRPAEGFDLPGHPKTVPACPSDLCHPTVGDDPVGPAHEVPAGCGRRRTGGRPPRRWSGSYRQA